MKLIKILGRTSIWMDYDAYGQLQYRIYPPFSPPTVDVNGCVSVCLDRFQAYEEAKRIDALFSRSFEACLDQRAESVKYAMRYRKEYAEGGLQND